MSETRTPEAQQGYQDFKDGKNFAQCPYEGFRPDDINRRWNWQQGWLHAERDKLAEKPKP